MFGRLFIYIYQIFGHVLGETYQTYKHWTFLYGSLKQQQKHVSTNHPGTERCRPGSQFGTLRKFVKQQSWSQSLGECQTDLIDIPSSASFFSSKFHSLAQTNFQVFLRVIFLFYFFFQPLWTIQLLMISIAIRTMCTNPSISWKL